MPDTATKPTVLAAAPDPDPDTDGKDGGGDAWLGRAWDIAGVAAAVVLGVIIFDIVSGGKVTRFMTRRKGCDGCGDGEAGEVPGDG